MHYWDDMRVPQPQDPMSEAWETEGEMVGLAFISLPLCTHPLHWSLNIYRSQ
jgi:hypothetical protein